MSNLTEIINIVNDVNLINEELIFYGLNIKIEEIEKIYYLNNRDIIEVISYYLYKNNITPSIKY